MGEPWVMKRKNDKDMEIDDYQDHSDVLLLSNHEVSVTEDISDSSCCSYYTDMGKSSGFFHLHKPLSLYLALIIFVCVAEC